MNDCLVLFYGRLRMYFCIWLWNVSRTKLAKKEGQKNRNYFIVFRVVTVLEITATIYFKIIFVKQKSEKHWRFDSNYALIDLKPPMKRLKNGWKRMIISILCNWLKLIYLFLGWYFRMVFPVLWGNSCQKPYFLPKLPPDCLLKTLPKTLWNYLNDLSRNILHRYIPCSRWFPSHNWIYLL